MVENRFRSAFIINLFVCFDINIENVYFKCGKIMVINCVDILSFCDSCVY